MNERPNMAELLRRVVPDDEKHPPEMITVPMQAATLAARDVMAASGRAGSSGGDGLTAGASEASLKRGMRCLLHSAALRFGRMLRFAAVGGVGAAVNVAIMALTIKMGVGYLIAALIAAGVTILGNFLLQELFVFGDLRSEGQSLRVRFLSSVGFNVTEALLRLPVLWLMVQAAGIPSVLAQGITLMVAFVARFRFHSLVVYRPQHRSPGSPLRPSNRANSSDDRV